MLNLGDYYMLDRAYVTDIWHGQMSRVELGFRKSGEALGNKVVIKYCYGRSRHFLNTDYSIQF